MAGWLLFGAINRSNSFTKMYNEADLCKDYEKGNPNDTCPFFLPPMLKACDCEWMDLAGEVCTNYNGSDTRHLQFRFFEGQSDDTDADGTRFTSSFPDVGLYPNATNWWNGTMELPGSYKGVDAAGHATTYDRVRVTSALAAVEFPLYNYNPGIGEEKNLGSK